MPQHAVATMPSFIEPGSSDSRHNTGMSERTVRASRHTLKIETDKRAHFLSQCLESARTHARTKDYIALCIAHTKQRPEYTANPPVGDPAIGAYVTLMDDMHRFIVDRVSSEHPFRRLKRVRFGGSRATGSALAAPSLQASMLSGNTSVHHFNWLADA